MQEQDPIYDYVRQVMLEVMAVLWANGQRELHVGAMMRLIGVNEELARTHDNERIEIDEEFERMAQDLDLQHLIKRVPAGAIIH